MRVDELELLKRVTGDLEVLRNKVRQYLQHPSSDGHMNRKQLRKELKALVDIK